MKHNHNHSCVCEHETVRYCSHCAAVYCQNCNAEWKQQLTYRYSYTPWYNSGIGGYLASQTTTTPGNALPGNTWTNPPGESHTQTFSLGCKHDQ